MIKTLALPILLFVSAASLAQSAPVNFSYVDHGIYRGGNPNGPQRMLFLRKQGIKTIIDLQGADLTLKFLHNERREGMNEERRLSRANGIQWESMPVPALHFPTAVEQRRIHTIISQLDDPAIKPVYVHCGMGDDRTGLIIALYRVCDEHVLPEVAHQEMDRMGHSGLTGEFTETLDKYFWSVVNTPGWCPGN